MQVADRASVLDEVTEEQDLDAFFQFDDASNSNQQYLSGFTASDRFAFFRIDGNSILLVPPLEKGRAESDAVVDQVYSTAEYVDDDVRDDLDEEIRVIAKFLSESDVKRIAVPRNLDLYVAEKLEAEGFDIETIPDVVIDARKQKDEVEIGHLQTAQQATQHSIAYAEEILSESTIQDGTLHYDGEVLTAERLKTNVRTFLMREQCSLDESIIVCGPEGADPHRLGSGPLKSGQPILLDIYPQHESGYWGDMTRTFVKGTPPTAVQEMYDVTLEAFQTALSVLEQGSGVTGGEVHNAVCDVFESAGYPTIRQGDIEEGFLHSTGHAIGLDLHEPPRLVSDTGELEAGYALTIEPGLYDPKYGATRVEDMIIVTEDGYQNLNDYPYSLDLID
jgi:Xaa-Pro aminopeptidase